MDLWKLSAIEFKVYSYIQYYKETHNGHTPANLHISHIFGTSERTIQRAVKNLADKIVT